MSIFARRKPDQAHQEDLEAQARLEVEIATVRAVLARYPRGTKLHFGAPTKCPACGDYGFVRAVNRTRGTSQLDCFGCHTEWVISVQALKAVEDAPAPTAVEIVPLVPVALPDEVVLPAAPPPVAVPTAAAPAIVQLDPLSIIIDPAAPVADHPSIRPIPSPATRRAAVPSTSAPRGSDAAVPADRSARVATDAPLHVLVVEDNPFDVAVLDELLGGVARHSVELRHAPTLADGVQLAHDGPVDVVLLDLGLPDSTGIATLLEWQLASTTAAPVIVMTGDNHPDTVREAQLLGAAQFVHKQHVAELVNRADGSAKLLRLLQSTAAAATRAAV